MDTEPSGNAEGVTRQALARDAEPQRAPERSPEVTRWRLEGPLQPHADAAGGRRDEEAARIGS